jgi:hypothetical protein
MAQATASILDSTIETSTDVRSNVRVFAETHMGTQEEPVSDTRDTHIDRVIWAVLVITIIGIGWLIVSSL